MMRLLFNALPVGSVAFSSLLLSSVVNLAGPSPAFAADVFDPTAITDVKIEEIHDQEGLSVSRLWDVESQSDFAANMPSFQDVLEGASAADLLLDHIVNLGKKLWALVESNRAVVNLDSSLAHALPQGVERWQQMQDWQTPVSRLFHASYNTFLGLTAVDFTYRLIYTYGGSVQGKGLYLTNIRVVPAALMVRSGFTFNAQVTTVVTNAGTVEAPVAGSEILVNWSMDSWIKHSEGSHSLYVRGDGKFENLSGHLSQLQQEDLCPANPGMN